MVALTFPNSPTNGQTVVINETTYIYKTAITAWELLFNAPPQHSVTHELDGADQLLLDPTQIDGLNKQIVPIRQYAASGSILQNIPATVHPGERLLRQSVWWIDSSHESAREQVVPNLGWGGALFDAKVGSTSGSDAGDPLFIPWSGENYLYLPGGVDNNATITAPATSTNYVATRNDGTTATGSVTPGSFSFDTAGSWKSLVVRNAANNILVNIDFSQISSGSNTTIPALTGQAVTIVRGSSGRKAVCVTSPMWLFGSDDFMETSSRWIEYAGSVYAFLPGLSGNYLSTPDAAPLDIVGNIDIKVNLSLEDWTPTVTNTILSKAGEIGNWSYFFEVTSTGALQFSWSVNGTNIFTSTSTAILNLQRDEIKWVRVTLDTDNDFDGNETRFFVSDNGTTWTQLGVNITKSGVTSIFSSTAAINISGYNNGTVQPLEGKVYRVLVLNEIEGTTVFDANIPLNVSVAAGNVSSFTSTSGQTVSVNRSGTSYRTQVITYSGYMEAGSEVITSSPLSFLDFTSDESFTIFAAYRPWNNQGTGDVLIGKKKNYTQETWGWALSSGSSSALVAQIQIGDGVLGTTAVSGNRVNGEVIVTSGVRDAPGNTLVVYNNTSKGAIQVDSTANTSSSDVMRIGSLPSGGGEHADMELFAAGIFRRALTDAEISVLSDYYGGREL